MNQPVLICWTREVSGSSQVIKHHQNTYRPAYLDLLESGELVQRVAAAYQHLEDRDLCARYCHVNRRESLKGVICRTGELLIQWLGLDSMKIKGRLRVYSVEKLGFWKCQILGFSIFFLRLWIGCGLWPNQKGGIDVSVKSNRPSYLENYSLSQQL